MLPLSLKVLWLVLALLGVPATWLVFIPFASTIGTYWASVLYCVTVTVLEGIFCLGIIWRMTPSNMPHGFCVAQTVIIALCFHVLTGVCGCFTWASYLTVFKPYRSIQASASALLWRRAYYLFVIVFPVLAFTAHLAAVLKTHSVQPMNDMHCDNTSPLWPRLLGYAGTPIVLFTPCFILSILTAIRVLEMRARLRAFQSQDSNQCQTIHAGNNGPHIAIPVRSVASPMTGVSDKLHPRTLDGQTGMKIDVQLDRSMTQSSSRVSLPLTRGTIESMSSNAHIPIELSSLIIPSVHPSQPSPTPSNDSALFPAIDRSKTPSPIVFASASTPSPRRHQGQLDGAGESSSSNGCVSSAHEMSYPDHSDERPTSPASPSRAPISLEVGERMPGFHLPTRSPPTSLRPSLELSPDYVRARLEEDLAAGNPSASPHSPHRHPLSNLATRNGSDVIGSLPSITYTDHVLERLPEVDEADRASVVKFVDEPKVAVSTNQVIESPLKPVRQFYRSAPRPSVGRPPGLEPAIWRLLIFQLVFFFILILASLSTLIDLARDRDSPTAFGTQHFAILLVAWCPAIIFGCLPGDRNPFLPRHCWT